MKIDLFPVKIEGYDDEMKDGVFTVSASDEACAEVKITTAVNVQTWDELSAAIRKALLMMKLEGDVKK